MARQRGYDLPESVADGIQRYRVCELSTLAKDGTPITHPLCTWLMDDGRFRLTTSIGLPTKAFNVRRNPKVSLLFSEPAGSGLSGGPVVLVQGDAEAPDAVETLGDEAMQHYWLHRIMRRQPAGAMMSAWLMRPLTWWYYLRIFITVTPRRIRWWPDGDMSRSAQEVAIAPTQREPADVG